MDSFLFNFKLKKKTISKTISGIALYHRYFKSQNVHMQYKSNIFTPILQILSVKKKPWINGMSYSVLHAGQFLHRSKVKCSDLHLTLKVLEKRSVIESILNQPSNLYLSVSNWVKFYQFQPLSTDSHQATMKNIKHFANFAKICAIIYYVII